MIGGRDYIVTDFKQLLLVTPLARPSMRRSKACGSWCTALRRGRVNNSVVLVHGPGLHASERIDFRWHIGCIHLSHDCFFPEMSLNVQVSCLASGSLRPPVSYHRHSICLKAFDRDSTFHGVPQLLRLHNSNGDGMCLRSKQLVIEWFAGHQCLLHHPAVADDLRHVANSKGAFLVWKMISQPTWCCFMLSFQYLSITNPGIWYSFPTWEGA